MTEFAYWGFFFLGYLASSLRERWRMYRKPLDVLVAQEMVEYILHRGREENEWIAKVRKKDYA